MDNYDSFTWNLAHDLEGLGAAVEVRLNDQVTCAWVREQGFDAIVISPGPGRPERAGISMDLVRDAAGQVPLLGVCLGHQAIARVFGGRVVRAPALMHGKTSEIFHEGEGVFGGLPSPFVATRYHSLVVEEASLSREIVVDARTADGVVMGLRHRALAVYGVQFHPESILTVEGHRLLGNFLRLAGTAK